MENRIVKFKSKESAGLNLHAIPGHFATSHSHINYYVDVTSIKTRVSEAKEAAKALYTKVPHHSYIDTIVCMDGNGLMSVNKHETIYVVSPEINNGQMLFRDNNKGAIDGKHVVLLLATTTTGETIRRAMECINYYGGMVTCIASIFSTIDEVNGVKIDKLFDDDDVVNYQTYPVTECPFCKKGLPIEAMVNGFGYSKL